MTSRSRQRNVTFLAERENQRPAWREPCDQPAFDVVFLVSAKARLVTIESAGRQSQGRARPAEDRPNRGPPPEAGAVASPGLETATSPDLRGGRGARRRAAKSVGFGGIRKGLRTESRPAYPGRATVTSATLTEAAAQVAGGLKAPSEADAGSQPRKVVVVDDLDPSARCPTMAPDQDRPT